MKPIRLFLCAMLLVLLAPGLQALALELSPADATRIGHRVWENECAGTVEGLVSWNAGEAFPSLGIGHFIWYPAGKRGPFEESFPPLVALLQKRGVKVPPWLHGPAPWPTSAAMARDPARVRELRSLLAANIGIQTEFLIHRLETALPKMLAAAPRRESAAIRQRFQSVGATPAGAFALIDYVNFKGEGVLETERYKGQGGGLLQVLQGMSGSGEPVRDFSNAAKRVLARRVRNAPPERHEERWLPGWQSRVERYAAPVGK